MQLKSSSNGEKVEKKKVIECSCGNRVEITEGCFDCDSEVCESCGAIIDRNAGACSFSVADTQMVNIQEMAKMAQEGIDVSVSGEWDTTKLGPDNRDK
jgi:DNA replicative helicase MCM subunit Mcm2 (Cdc46/Mcm family)